MYKVSQLEHSPAETLLNGLTPFTVHQAPGAIPTVWDKGGFMKFSFLNKNFSEFFYIQFTSFDPDWREAKLLGSGVGRGRPSWEFTWVADKA